MARRTYGQYCALARTLDVVGERWTLLVIRELIIGPRRYSDLLSGLPGIGTSLLAERLRHLESSGLVARRTLAPPAASTVYELTDAGEELVRALLPLVAWGARHQLGPIGDGEHFNVAWPLLALREGVDRSRLDPDADLTYEFDVGGSVAHLRCTGGRLDVHEGPAPGPADVRVRSDAEAFVDVGTGRLDPEEAVVSGRMEIEGEPAAVAQMADVLGVGGS